MPELERADIETIVQCNRELARQINLEALHNPRSTYAGKFVGIANGQVVIVTDSLDELAAGLKEAEPDPARTFGLEAGLDYDKVQYV